MSMCVGCGEEFCRCEKGIEKVKQFETTNYAKGRADERERLFLESLDRQLASGVITAKQAITLAYIRGREFSK